MSRSEELRALADSLEVMEEAERKMAEAKAAFYNDRDDEVKWAAYRVAVDEMAEIRRDTRNSPIGAVSMEPGSATIIPGAVQTAMTGKRN